MVFPNEIGRRLLLGKTVEIGHVATTGITLKTLQLGPGAYSGLSNSEKFRFNLRLTVLRTIIIPGFYEGLDATESSCLRETLRN